jgi:pyridoxine 4-dehydrogenase
MGRGMLTGQIKSFEDILDKDIRKILPRFQPENFQNNMKLVTKLEAIAMKEGCIPAQLALGWVRSLSKREGMPEIIPIPGATTIERVIENSVKVDFIEEEMKEIDSILASCEIIGDRYHSFGMKLVNG